MNQSIAIVRHSFPLCHTKPPKHFKFLHNKADELWDDFYMNSAIWRQINISFLWLTQTFSWVLWILEFSPVKFDSMFLGQLENAIFHHYSPQIHVVLFNLPWKVQNKCQIFSTSFYHSECVAQSLQKPSCSDSLPVRVSALIANPLLEHIQSLTFSTFSLVLFTLS